MPNEEIIKSGRGLNNLPINRRVASTFYVENQEDYIGLGNVNQVLLRRACAVRNIKFYILKKKKNLTVWMAFGENKAIRFIKNMPAQTTSSARRIAVDKQKTKEYLHKVGVQVPVGKLINHNDTDGALLWFNQLHPKKAVVKPNSGSLGRGVTSSITSPQELLQAMEKVGGKKVILEQHIDGEEHRLLVIGGKLAAAIRWLPAFVIGDGESTLESLVKEKNLTRSSNPYIRRFPLSLGDDVLKKIEDLGLTKDSVVPKGYRVQLQSKASTGPGEESEDITKKVHPDFVSIAESCWHALPDIAFCGIDLIAEDISKPASEQRYAVLEVNANCDIAMHHFPTCGDAIDVAGALIDYLFPYNPPLELCNVKASIVGRVQGVGFRKWIKKLSVLYGVNGYCKKMNDREVSVVLEGSDFSVNEMLRWCGKGPEKISPSFIDFERQHIAGYRDFTIK